VTTSRRTFLAQFGIGSAAALFERHTWAQTFKSNDALSTRLAADPLRPQFHLLPRANWMNDPCGPIFAGGRYHMFFQYNPDGAYWGDMHWAHASSPDLVHWQHEVIALAPAPGSYDRDGVFSGCAVLDQGVPTLIYTGVAPPTSPADATLRDGAHTWREVQCVAVSHDGWKTWQKAPAPVISVPPAGLAVTGFRDPCVWREDRDWMLALGSGVRGQGGAILLYRSSDLHHWRYVHPLFDGAAEGRPSVNPVDTGEMWECPDFFPLGGSHVLLVSTAGKVRWHVGRYEQQRFLAEKSGSVDFGAYYAARSMLDRDENRVLWGWIPERRPESAYRAAGWAGVMSLPRVLSLGDDGSLRMEPAPALRRLREQRARVVADGSTKSSATAVRIHNLAAEIAVELVPTRAFRLQLIAQGEEPFVELEYQPDRRGSELRLNRTYSSFPHLRNANSSLRLFVDGSVIELFAGATAVITDRVYNAPASPLHIDLEGTADRLEVWQMKPISRDRLTS